MHIPQHRNRRCGLTRIEVLVIVGVCLILASFAFGPLTKAKVSRSRIKCATVLRNVGVGVLLFATDNSDHYPWAISTNGRGSQEYAGLGSQTFRHFVAMSNELSAPALLICRQDNRMGARNWADLRNTNISYFLGLDADNKSPASVVAGDRNITALSSVILDAAKSEPLNWVPSLGLHGNQGNIAFADGHVEQVDSVGLRKAVARNGTATNRFAIP